MKAVFLDIDGVLNSEEYFGSDRCVPRAERIGAFMEKLSGDLDPLAVGRLNEVLRRTGAVVVVSSGWRYRGIHGLRQMLRWRGFEGEIVDVTPQIRPGTPADEIEWWIRCGPGDLESYVVLEDIHPSRMGTVAARHVWTPWEEGLLDHHVEEAVRILDAVEDERGVLPGPCACGFWVPRSVRVWMGEMGKFGIVHYECPRCLTMHAEFVTADGRVAWRGTAAPVQAPAS